MKKSAKLLKAFFLLFAFEELFSKVPRYFGHRQTKTIRNACGLSFRVQNTITHTKQHASAKLLRDGTVARRSHYEKSYAARIAINGPQM